jgi:hypothetical protein
MTQRLLIPWSTQSGFGRERHHLLMPVHRSGEGGIRTTLEIPANSALLDERAAKSDALAITDPELLHVVRSWPDLPEPIKLAVLALVRSRLA